MSTLTVPTDHDRRSTESTPLRSLVTDKTDLLALLGGCLVLALPFLVLHHVNTVDGPGHLLGGLIIGKLRHAAVVEHYYKIHFSWVPNVLMQYLLLALTSVLSPTWAEKLFVVGYVFAFPLAFRFAIRSVNRGAGWLALGALPLTVNRPLVTGFYSFSYAMVFALLAIGVAIRARGRWGAGNVALLALLLVITWSGHPVPLGVAVCVIAGFTVVDSYRQIAGRPETQTPAEVLGRTALGPAIAVAPAVLMMLAFIGSGGAGGKFATYLNPGSLLWGAASLSLPVTSYTGWEVVASLLTVAVLVAAVVVAARADKSTPLRRSSLPYLVAVAISVVLYLLVPDNLGGDSTLSARLALFVPLMLLLLCASAPIRTATLRRLGLAFLAVTVVLVAIRLPTQVHEDRVVSEYLSAERVIPPGASLLQVSYRSYGLLNPLAHEVSRVAADRHDVDLVNVESLGPDYQETLRQPLRRMSWQHLLSKPDLRAYLDAGGTVDYVLVVGMDDPTPGFRGAPAADLRQELASRYTRVMVSRSGLVQVFRLRQAG